MSFNNGKHYSSQYVRVHGLTDELSLQRTEIFQIQLSGIENASVEINRMLEANADSRSAWFRDAFEDLNEIMIEIEDTLAYVEAYRLEPGGKKKSVDRSRFENVENRIIEFFAILIKESEQPELTRKLAALQNMMVYKANFWKMRGSLMSAAIAD